MAHYALWVPGASDALRHSEWWSLYGTCLLFDGLVYSLALHLSGLYTVPCVLSVYLLYCVLASAGELG